MEILIIAFASIVMSCIVLALLWPILTFIITCNESYNEFGIRKIFTKEFFYEWFSTMKENFSIKGTVMLVSILAVCLLPGSYEAHQKAIARKKGECICKCEVCKHTHEQIEALVKKLALDKTTLQMEKKED